MALSTQPYKGARDFYPEDLRVRKYLFSKMREVAERFGYEEYDAPILEPTELFLSKGNQEIIEEQTYTFQDRGGRSVTVRTEMTPTVSRMVAGKRQELAYPLRLYSIPNLWRYERAQRGRLREFWQLNVDMFGVEGVAAEQEMVMMIAALFRSYGAKPDTYTIRLSSRKFIDYVMGQYLGLEAVQATSMVRLIDRMKKMDRADFIAQADAICRPDQRDAGIVEKMLDVLAAQRITALPQPLQNQPDLLRLQELITLLQDSGVTNAQFDVTLMRGFDYYTDILFEAFDTDPENSRSIMGGGRYDGLVGLFGVEPVPTVGWAMGDVVLEDFLRTHGLIPKLPPETDLYVVLAGDVLEQAQKVIGDLRSDGLNVAVDVSGRKLDKQLATAAKKGIRYALIIGEQELADSQFTLRDLHAGTEEKHSIARIVSIVKDFRHPKAPMGEE